MKTEQQLNRTEAAKSLYECQKCYEARPLKYSTVYRKIYKCGGLWHLNGHAHNYTV